MDEISEAHIVYNDFQAGKPDPSLFMVDNLDSCPKDSKSDCDDDVRGSALRFLASVSDKKTVLYHSAKADGKKVAPKKVKNTHKSKYKCSQQTGLVCRRLTWCRTRVGMKLMGDKRRAAKQAFQPKNQIILQYRIASSYHDVTHNRSRIEDPVAGLTVADYNALKLMTIRNNGTERRLLRILPDRS